MSAMASAASFLAAENPRRVSFDKRRMASSAAATLFSWPLSAMIIAAVATTRGSGSFRYARMSSAAFSRRIAASARTAAARTSELGSFNIRSTAGAHFSAMSGLADANAARARARTLSEP
jgi:hypothetical protein